MLGVAIIASLLLGFLLGAEFALWMERPRPRPDQPKPTIPRPGSDWRY